MVRQTGVTNGPNGYQKVGQTDDSADGNHIGRRYNQDKGNSNAGTQSEFNLQQAE